MKQDEAVSTILGCSISGYYKWKKQNRLIINLLEKYFTKEDLEEFIKIGKIMRIEDNKDQELLNNEASKIYNHFISSLYLKDKTLLKLFLIVINKANETSANLNLNFIDLVFEAEDEKENKIKLIKEFNKISQNSNTLFFYSIKFMVQNGFDKISYNFFNEYYGEDNMKMIWFIINYIQLFLELFHKKEFMSYEEYYNFNLKKTKNQEENNSNIYYIPGIENSWTDFSKNYSLEKDEDLEMAYYNSLVDYKNYLKSLILNSNLNIKFRISPNENDEFSEHILNLK